MVSYSKQQCLSVAVEALTELEFSLGRKNRHNLTELELPLGRKFDVGHNRPWISAKEM